MAFALGWIVISIFRFINWQFIEPFKAWRKQKREGREDAEGIRS
jgi:hypothetical protein